jgi:hypothetical protein
MKFYIDITGADTCFVSDIKKICDKRGYKYQPRNKKYYEVNTETKICLGVESIKDKKDIVGIKTSYIEIQKKFAI